MKGIMYFTQPFKDLKITILISVREDNFEIVEEPMKTYNNIYMLNLENQTLTPGKSLLIGSIGIPAYLT